MAGLPSPGAIDFKAVFDASPNPYLLLDRDLTVIGMNEAFLRITMKRRHDIVGRNIFSIFPYNPHHPEGSNLSEARRSIERVLRERMPDAMMVMRHDPHRPGGMKDSRSVTGAGSTRRSSATARSPPFSPISSTSRSL